MEDPPGSGNRGLGWRRERRGGNIAGMASGRESFFEALGVAATPEEDAALDALMARARAAWPQLAVSDEAFLAHLARVCPRGPPLAQALPALFAEDLYLACACAVGDRRAHAELERAALADARRALEHKLGDAAAAEDALQALRQHLLVGEEGRGRIADYAGRGPLSAWVRIAAVRTALNQRRSGAREVATEGERFERMSTPAAPPELGYIKARHRDDFKAAFESAFAGLERRQRMALRLQLIDGLSTAKIARIYGADPATVRRWLADARQQLLEGTRRHLAERLALHESQMETLMGMLVTQLDESVRRIFREGA